jgi:hypothetical protein
MSFIAKRQARKREVLDGAQYRLVADVEARVHAVLVSELNVVVAFSWDRSCATLTFLESELFSKAVLPIVFVAERCSLFEQVLGTADWLVPAELSKFPLPPFLLVQN